LKAKKVKGAGAGLRGAFCRDVIEGDAASMVLASLRNYAFRRILPFRENKAEKGTLGEEWR
jgi:hypothetical protein